MALPSELPPAQSLGNVIGWAEGREFVPVGDPYGVVTNVTRKVREVRGIYSYAEQRSDPVRDRRAGRCRRTAT